MKVMMLLGYNGAAADVRLGSGTSLPLSLKTRAVGDVTIVQCSGRIVAGPEAESLREHVCGILQDHRDIILHLGEVAFIDSSGLGMLVRLLTSTRRVSSDLKLCSLRSDTHKLLQMTSLIKLFDVHDSEEAAVSAFYRRKAPDGRASVVGPSLLCVDQSADVLAYLRELLRNAGYSVLTNNNLHDALILIHATRPRLLVLGPSLTASPGTMQSFRTACTSIPVVELGSEFSTLDAGRAASDLLKNVHACLHSQVR
jgi:anti-sigma B factor antagonist